METPANDLDLNQEHCKIKEEITIKEEDLGCFVENFCESDFFVNNQICDEKTVHGKRNSFEKSTEDLTYTNHTCENRESQRFTRLSDSSLVNIDIDLENSGNNENTLEGLSSCKINSTLAATALYPEVGSDTPEVHSAVDQPASHSENEVDLVRDLLLHRFTLRSYAEQLEIKNKGRPTPSLENVIINVRSQNQSRTFKDCWYKKTPWLTGSLSLKKLFCWPCLLFSERSASDSWTVNGFDDLKNLSRAVGRHSSSKDHLSCTSKLILFGKFGSTNLSSNPANRSALLHHTEDISHYKDILKRLIDVAVLLCQGGISFQGEDERQSLSIYDESVKFLAKYDEILQTHLGTSNVLVPTCEYVKNYLVYSINDVLGNDIDREISESLFFSVEISGVSRSSSCRNQLSAIVRYVDKLGHINETFLGFVEGCRNAQNLFTKLDVILSKYDYKTRLVCQSYGGSALVDSQLNELQATIKVSAPQAIFLHCYAHQLNLILGSGTTCIHSSKLFFARLFGLMNFLTNSPELFHEIEKNSKLSFFNVCLTNFTSMPVETVYEHYEDLVRLCESIVQSDCWTLSTVDSADRCLQVLKTFHFVFLLHLYNKIFAITSRLENIFQTTKFDVLLCNLNYEMAIREISNLRGEEIFKQIYNQTKSLAEEPEKRKFRKGDSVVSEVDSEFCELFYRIIDNILYQLSIRFKDMKTLQFLQLMEHSQFKHFQKYFPEDSLELLLQTYPNYFEVQRLKKELCVLYREPRILGNGSSIAEQVDYFHKTDMRENLSEVYKLLVLFATFPLSPPSVDREISGLKRTNLSRLYSLDQKSSPAHARIFIEKERVSKLQLQKDWYDKVVDAFSTLEREGADVSLMNNCFLG